MDIKPAEISSILKEQIANFGSEAEVAEASPAVAATMLLDAAASGADFCTVVEAETAGLLGGSLGSHDWERVGACGPSRPPLRLRHGNRNFHVCVCV